MNDVGLITFRILFNLKFKVKHHMCIETHERVESFNRDNTGKNLRKVFF